jgi:hypothetical protein
MPKNGARMKLLRPSEVEMHSKLGSKRLLSQGCKECGRLLGKILF